MENILENISIKEYVKLLRANYDKELLSEIDKEISKNLSDLQSINDLSLFMLQKDLLIFQCKLAIAIFDFEEDKIKLFEKKISELREQIVKKTSNKKVQSPYKSFLTWILSVEKFLGFSINRENDLLYFIEATKQMLNSFEAQKKSIEENKVKK